MSNAAARQKNYRQRQMAGEICITVCVDESMLVAALLEAGLLQPLQALSRDEIESATQRVVNIFCKDDDR